MVTIIIIAFSFVIIFPAYYINYSPKNHLSVIIYFSINPSLFFEI